MTTQMRDQIQGSLAALIGKPMWDSFRALDLQMFEFGERMETINRNGRPQANGEFLLHVQCPWHLTGADGRVQVASGDRVIRGDGTGDFIDEHDDARLPTRLEVRMRASLRDIAARQWIVRQIKATEAGGLTLMFDDGGALTLFPDCSLEGQTFELWRFFSHDHRVPHFVVYSGGIDVGGGNDDL